MWVCDWFHLSVTNAICINAYCPQCHAPPTGACCDLCNPHLFADIAIVSVTQASRKTRKATVKPYKIAEHKMAFHLALQTWCDEETIRHHGMATHVTYGPILIMSDQLLERIVDLVHASKIKDATYLKNETLWTKSDKYAPEILTLIAQHAPLPPPPPHYELTQVSVDALYDCRPVA